MFEFCKHLFHFQFLLIVLAVIAGVYYPQILDWITQRSSRNDSLSTDGMLFTKKQLATFNGVDGKPLYLAILGHVYDVTKGVKHYGEGCSYNYFVGRDASVSFISGEFEKYDEATADDVLELKPSELLSLDNWKSFYDKDYSCKGKLIGRFFDHDGAQTKYYQKYLALVEQAREAKAESEQLRLLYPDCNIEWSAEKGTRVWCTTSSGGKERSWIGYPRKLFTVGSDTFRCACMSGEELESSQILLRSYENCESLAHECYYKAD